MVQPLGFLPISLCLWSKTPSWFNKVGRREKLLQESSQPSLAHQSRTAAVGVKQALPGGTQAPPAAPRLLTAKHPNVPRRCSRDRFCSPCFYFRFDTVTMITVANIPQKLPGDLEHGVSSPASSPYFALKTQDDCQNSWVSPLFWMVSITVQNCHMKHSNSIISKDNGEKK